MKGTIEKLSVTEAPDGSMREKLLVGTDQVALRYWQELPPRWPNNPKEQEEWTIRQYDTLGYVIKGRAELQTEGKSLKLQPGDSWRVPRGVRHRYVISEPLEAIEATHPAARETQVAR